MLAGFDRDRVFYLTPLIPIATYCVLFAVIGRSTPAVITGSLVACAFLMLALAGFKRNLCVVAGALAVTKPGHQPNYPFGLEREWGCHFESPISIGYKKVP